MTTKHHKAQVIAQITQAIADHCNVNAHHVLSNKLRRGQALKDARAMLCHHLYTCGMSYDAIARLLGRSNDTVRRACSIGGIRLLDADRELLSALPRVPTTIQTTQSKEP